jgi:hypothetical protein
MEEEAILREQEKLRRELAILSYVVSSSTHSRSYVVYNNGYNLSPRAAR